MTFAAKLGGVSTLRPKAARLRDPPPKDVFGSFPNLYLSLPRGISFDVFKGHWPNLFSEILTNGILEFSELFLVAITAL